MVAFLLTFTQPVHSAAPNWSNGLNGNNGSASSEQDERALIELAQTMRRAGMVQFNFVDIDLAQFVRFMAELLQRNIIVPPTITGKISVISPKPSNLPEARQIFLSILQSQGWSLQDMGGYDKLVQGGLSFRRDVDRGKGGPGLGEEFVTYIVPLDYIVPDL